MKRIITYKTMMTLKKGQPELKIVLVGSGDSGKSAIFEGIKEMITIHGPDEVVNVYLKEDNLLGWCKLSSIQRVFELDKVDEFIQAAQIKNLSEVASKVPEIKELTFNKKPEAVVKKEPAKKPANPHQNKAQFDKGKARSKSKASGKSRKKNRK